MRTLIAFKILFLAFLLSGCAERHEKLLEPDMRGCMERAIVGEYLIKYKDEKNPRRIKANREYIITLLKDAKVEWAEPNYRVKTPKPVRAADILSDWQGGPLIGAEYAWSRGYSGQGVKIAIVDTGIDYRHPLLRRALQRGSNEWAVASQENGMDDDGNGYTDDIYGWNFADNVARVEDETGHGTHIAGIIAAATSSISRFRGVAPNSTLLAADFMNSDTGDEFNAIRAIDYSIKRGARIVNNSWSNFCSHSLREAFEGWQDLNIIFVSAAGNDGLHIDRLAIFPANLFFPNTVSVGSVSSGGSRSPFSNYGKNILVYAPGEEVYSLSVYGSGLDYLVPRSGTSMSTAFVSGALALAWSAFPEKTATELVSALRLAAGRQHGTAILNVRDLFAEFGH